MKKYILVFMFCLVAAGCVNTKVFMGSYDSVKITVSANQAQMTAENFPSEVQLSGGKLERKISEEPICVDTTDSDSCKASNFKGKLQVTIVCSDENFTKEFSKYFCKGEFTVEQKFHKPSNESIIISEVTIYPKRKVITDTEGEYHLIEFETMGGLNRGTHKVLVRDPLVFVFLPEVISADTEEIKLFLSYSGHIKDNTEIIPVYINIQALSKIISVMRKSIKVIFVKYVVL
ncbi:MAG TPA: hypothetical protein ACFYEF_07500 [Candidatus Wunengus sp. YC63]|uniref:hypothetical protein n=1 Tax=Candidatus Wunengus sp. YC63 TaxID=3367699 RepID=UPI0040264231